MNRASDRLMDLILFPRELYKRLTDKRWTLYAGVLMVGLVDIFLPDVLKQSNELFAGKTPGDLRRNIALAVAVVLVMGILDVFVFSIPLFDLFKYFKKRMGLEHTVTLVKVAKVYIMSHFLVIPVNVALYFLFLRDLNETSSHTMLLNAAFLIFVVTIWSSAIITRGINTLFDIGPLFGRLTFIVVFFWSFIFGTVLTEWLYLRLMGLFV